MKKLHKCDWLFDIVEPMLTLWCLVIVCVWIIAFSILTLWAVYEVIKYVL